MNCKTSCLHHLCILETCSSQNFCELFSLNLWFVKCRREFLFIMTFRQSFTMIGPWIRDPWSRSNWNLSFWPQLSCSHVTGSYWRSHHSFYFSGVRADQHLDVEIVGCYPHKPDHNTFCTNMVRLMGIGGLGAGSLAKGQ